MSSACSPAINDDAISKIYTYGSIHRCPQIKILVLTRVHSSEQTLQWKTSWMLHPLTSVHVPIGVRNFGPQHRTPGHLPGTHSRGMLSGTLLADRLRPRVGLTHYTFTRLPFRRRDNETGVTESWTVFLGRRAETLT